MESFNFLRIFLIVSIVVYFIFEKMDSKQVKDEREELIQLKTYKLVHQVMMFAISAIALLYIFMPMMDAIFPILAIVFCFLYTEILGKIYFRRKI